MHHRAPAYSAGVFCIYCKEMIVGIDEVGRGAWAGPLVMGAVLLGGASIDGLTDSKKLTRKQRERLDKEIRQKAVAIGLGWVSARHIDQIGLSVALRVAARRAMSHIKGEYTEIVIDGTVPFIDDPRVRVMSKADLLIPSVSAASIVAKVARDNYMKHIDMVFTGYKFAGHVGYGTAEHAAAIERLGVSPLHRHSFAPIAKRVKKVKPPTKQAGDAAETLVAEYLVSIGHAILARNWRTKYCEIDIVSECNGTVYFTEVKYRKTDAQGGGMAAITTDKLRRMTFAAELYAARHGGRGMDMLLAAADVRGTPPKLHELLELR